MAYDNIISAEDARNNFGCNTILGKILYEISQIISERSPTQRHADVQVPFPQSHEIVRIFEAKGFNVTSGPMTVDPPWPTESFSTIDRRKVLLTIRW